MTCGQEYCSSLSGPPGPLNRTPLFGQNRGALGGLSVDFHSPGCDGPELRAPHCEFPGKLRSWTSWEPQPVQVKAVLEGSRVSRIMSLGQTCV